MFIGSIYARIVSPTTHTTPTRTNKDTTITTGQTDVDQRLQNEHTTQPPQSDGENQRVRIKRRPLRAQPVAQISARHTRPLVGSNTGGQNASRHSRHASTWHNESSGGCVNHVNLVPRPAHWDSKRIFPHPLQSVTNVPD